MWCLSIPVPVQALVALATVLPKVQADGVTSPADLLSLTGRPFRGYYRAGPSEVPLPLCLPLENTVPPLYLCGAVLGTTMLGLGQGRPHPALSALSHTSLPALRPASLAPQEGPPAAAAPSVAPLPEPTGTEGTGEWCPEGAHHL